MQIVTRKLRRFVSGAADSLQSEIQRRVRLTEAFAYSAGQTRTGCSTFETPGMVGQP